MEHLGHQNDQTERAKQAGCCTFNRAVRPLALGFKSEMSSDFLKGNLDVQTGDEPQENLLCRDRWVGTEVSLSFEAVLGTAHQYPANRDRIIALAIPERCARYEFDGFLDAAIPYASHQSVLITTKEQEVERWGR